MSKILYVIDDNEKSDYKYNINEDTIIYHFSINGSSHVEVNLCSEGVSLYYYYNTINYTDNKFHILVNHEKGNTHSEVFNHGVNVHHNYLTFTVDGVVPKESFKCICNQDNQIINMKNGKSAIRPNLFIENYDVLSNHAAYIGKFKDEVLFYLMSRGISRKTAYELLLRSFLIDTDSIDLSKIDKFILEINKI